MRLDLALIAAAAATVAALTASTPAAAVEFRSADVHNADDYPTVAAVRHMSELLDKRSGGKYRIKVFNKGALGTEKETIDQVKIGALDLTRVNISPMNSICAKTMVPTMPFLFSSVAHMRKALDGPAGEEILKSCEAQGFVGLAFYDSGARSIYGNKPVKTLADAKGMKIRVQQSDLWVALVSAMGANPTPMPIGEVYTGLKTKLIDAAENNVPSYEGFKHFEAVKFYSKTEHSMAPEMLLMSKAVFDKLPKADQDLFRAAAKESVAFQRQKWDEQEARSMAAVKAGGAQIIDVDKASFQAVMAPVYDKFMTTPDLKRLVKAIQDNPVTGARAAQGYTRLCAALSKASLVLAVVGLIGVILAVQTQVVGRYIFNDTPTWAEALALQLVLYVTALGVAVGVRDAGHIGLESMVALLPPLWRHRAELLIHACVALFGVLMAQSGWMWTTLKWDDMKPMLGLPVGLDYLALVICGVLVVLFSVEHIVALLRGQEVEPAWN